MPISIRNPRTEQLAREVAQESHESITQAITLALEERLERIRGRRTANDTAQEILAISRRCRSLPNLDGRAADEILGYDDNGVPH